MINLSIALAYYENPHMLREQQRVLGTYPSDLRSKVRLIVADDASPEHPAHKAAAAADGYELEIYRIEHDRPWGQLRARNLGMHVAPDGWVLATDIDHVLPPASAGRLLEVEPEPGCYYTLARRMPDGSETNPHPNSYLMERRWFWEEVGGCDEAFVGSYGTDSLFRARAVRVGKAVHLSGVWLVVYNRDGKDIGGIPGAATSKWGRKKTSWHAKSNPAVKRRMQLAEGRRPEKVLQFEWTRMR